MVFSLGRNYNQPNPHFKGPLKTYFLPNIKDFYIIFKISFQFQAYKNLCQYKNWENMKKIAKKPLQLKKIQLQYRYQNWTLVSVSNNETLFQSYTTTEYLAFITLLARSVLKKCHASKSPYRVKKSKFLRAAAQKSVAFKHNFCEIFSEVARVSFF